MQVLLLLFRQLDGVLLNNLFLNGSASLFIELLLLGLGGKWAPHLAFGSVLPDRLHRGCAVIDQLKRSIVVQAHPCGDDICTI